MGAGCCKLCAWWSVIGAATYFTLALMVAGRNWSVIKEKFEVHIKESPSMEQSDEINGSLADLSHKMYMMVIVMIISSFVCFALGFVFAKREQAAEAREKASREQGYGMIFGDDTLESKGLESSQSGSFQRQPEGATSDNNTIQ